MSGKPIVKICPINSADEIEWKEMWQAFIEEAGAPFDPAVMDANWIKMLDERSNIHGIKAVSEEGEMLSFSTYFYHEHTWHVGSVCCMCDSYVKPSARGQGINPAVIDAVCQIAQNAGSTQVYWTTHRRNYGALKLYDTLARQVEHFKYVIDLS